MTNGKYRTTPEPITTMPSGVPFIIGNEAAERFSYYGMRSILVVFMTKFLVDANGHPDPMSNAVANQWTHLFYAAVYWFPLLGSILADVFIGRYLTIMSLSVVYCLGHLALALNDTRAGLLVGLTLIAIGAGGIKPCVSANVGDQFGSTNKNLLTRVYIWFYFSINVGSAVAMYAIPAILYSPAIPKYFHMANAHLAFGLPGVLMLIATIVFWMGRKKYVHVPPTGRNFFPETFANNGFRALAGLLPVYVVISVWWSLYDQCSTTWVEQAEKMDLHFLGKTWTPPEIQIWNPIFVLAYVPLFSYVIYPVAGRFFTVTPLRKMSVGLFFTVVCYLVGAWVEKLIGAGQHPTMAWQVLAYAFLMASEIMVYATGLEFSYTQAPSNMKSMVMALYLATNSAGNLFTALVNHYIQNPDGKTVWLQGVPYYLFFSGLMFVASIAFIFIAMFYKGKSYLPDTKAVAA